MGGSAGPEPRADLELVRVSVAPEVRFGDTRLPERFWSKVEQVTESGCWIWIASLNHGYGQIAVGHARPKQTHRLAYRMLVREISPGLQLDHKCRIRCCVNPAHLREVTSRQNTLAEGSRAIPRMRLDAPTCVHGHPWTVENTAHYRTYRICRMCQRRKSIAAYYRKKARRGQA